MLPIKIQKYLVKRTTLESMMEMITKFPECIDEIAVMIDSKLKHFHKQLQRREENICELIPSLGVAEKKKANTPNYEKLHQSISKIILDEYKQYRNIKTSYLQFAQLRKGKGFIQGI